MQYGGIYIDELEIARKINRMYADMNIDKADELCRLSNYGSDHCDNNGENPVSWADASAFFLEGYTCAMNELAKFIKLGGFSPCCPKCNKPTEWVTTIGEYGYWYCFECSSEITIEETK